MDNLTLEKQNDLLWILVVGCSKHMAYRARKVPSTNCVTCGNMWRAMQYLGDPPDRVSEIYNGEPHTACEHCYDHTVHSTASHYRSITSTRR